MAKLTKEIHQKVLKKYRKGTQTYLAYAYLVRGNRLSTGEFFNICGAMRLPNKICNLRADGVPIKDRTLNNKTREKVYWIDEEDLEIFRGVY